MNIKLGKRYLLNDVKVVALAYNIENGVLMVKETDGNLIFVLGNFTVDDDKLIVKNTTSFTVTDSKMLDCINSYLTENNTEKITTSIIVTAIRNTYYKIPTRIAEVIAEWYIRL